MEESSKSIIESMKASDEKKMTLFMSIQQTMQKLVDKLWVVFLSIIVCRERLCHAGLGLCHPETSCNTIFSCTKFLCYLVSRAPCNFKLPRTCLRYSNVSLELSSMRANVCKTLFATANLSCPDAIDAVPMANASCILSVASCNHSFFQKVSPNMMQMLCSSKYMLTSSGTFFNCTSTYFKIMRHLFLIRMPVQCTYSWSSTRCSSGTPLSSNRLCGPWTEPTSTDDKGMRHLELKRIVRVFPPRKIFLYASSITSSHRA